MLDLCTEHSCLGARMGCNYRVNIYLVNIFGYFFTGFKKNKKFIITIYFLFFAKIQAFGNESMVWLVKALRISYILVKQIVLLISSWVARLHDRIKMQLSEIWLNHCSNSSFISQYYTFKLVWLISCLHQVSFSRGLGSTIYYRGWESP